MIKLAPSILAADFTRLGEQVQAALDAGVKWIHLDIMDGHFVPNISFGPLVVGWLRPLADRYQATLDVHLMIEQPDRYLADFAAAGADVLTVHVETCPHLDRTIQAIRELHVRPGVTLNPATPLAAVEEVLPDVDLVLIMSVNPGFGGQRFIPRSLDRIARMRQMLTERSLDHMEIEVDGGINPSTIVDVVRAGATVLVAGSAVFNQKAPVRENIAHLRQLVEQALPVPIT
ncbi:MAG: ribulose-phosphate 3-epimerase [Caldilineae bacterium]|nr:MAG: ribulose-phosphate 3-epimerase [Caldilineae bacterium]